MNCIWLCSSRSTIFSWESWIFLKFDLKGLGTFNLWCFVDVTELNFLLECSFHFFLFALIQVGLFLSITRNTWNRLSDVIRQMSLLKVCLFLIPVFVNCDWCTMWKDILVHGLKPLGCQLRLIKDHSSAYLFAVFCDCSGLISIDVLYILLQCCTWW